MASTRSVTLHLNIVLDAEPVTGEVSATGLGAWEFCGWTDLFASLHAALAALRSMTDEPLEERQKA
jgi:hypothetical protein